MAELNFGILDTQLPGRIAAIPQQIQQSQMQNALQGLQMQHAAGQNELAKYQLSSAKRTDTEAEQLRNLFKTRTDYTTPEFVQSVYAISPEKGQTYAKALQEQKTAALTQSNLTSQIGKRDLDTQLAKGESALNTLSRLASVPGGATDAAIDAALAGEIKNGILDPAKAEQMAAQFKSIPLAARPQQFQLFAMKANERLTALTSKPQVVGNTIVNMNPLAGPVGGPVPGAAPLNIPLTPLAKFIADKAAAVASNAPPAVIAAYDDEINKEKNLEKDRQARLKVLQGNLAVNQAGLNLRRSEADPFGINGGGGGVPVAPVTNALTVSPANQLRPAVAPVVAAAAAPVLTVANAFKQNLHGDEFLAALPPAVRNEVNAIVTGNTPPPNQNSKRGQQLMQLVTQADPSFDASAYGVKFAGEKSFLVKQGPAVKSFNVLVSHFDTLDKAATALNNGDVKAFNSIGNTIAAQTGSTAPTDFAGVKKIVGDEIIKAIQGGAGALGDRKAIQDELSAANSPAQLASLINRFKVLAGGQLGGLAKQYESATGKTNFQDRFLTPEARKVFKTGSAAVGGGVDTSNPLLK